MLLCLGAHRRPTATLSREGSPEAALDQVVDTGTSERRNRLKINQTLKAKG